MSRWIDADALRKLFDENLVNVCHDVVLKVIDETPSIDLDDYVPKEFHDKTCEAMAQRHQQEEIANMVSIVRCKECKWADKCSQNVAMQDTYQMYEKIDFCSYGERRE